MHGLGVCTGGRRFDSWSGVVVDVEQTHPYIVAYCSVALARELGTGRWVERV